MCSLLCNIYVCSFSLKGGVFQLHAFLHPEEANIHFALLKSCYLFCYVLLHLHIYFNVEILWDNLCELQKNYNMVEAPGTDPGTKTNQSRSWSIEQFVLKKGKIIILFGSFICFILCSCSFHSHSLSHMFNSFIYLTCMTGLTIRMCERWIHRMKEKEWETWIRNEGTRQVKSMVLKSNYGVDDAMSHTNKILWWL